MKISKELRAKLSILYLILVADLSLYVAPIDDLINALLTIFVILFILSIICAISFVFDLLN